MEKLIMIIGQERSERYNEWRQVGQAMYNVNPENIELFHRFSRRTQIGNYDEIICNNMWKHFEKHTVAFDVLNLGYLERIAETDNPREYREIYLRDISLTNMGILLLNETRNRRRHPLPEELFNYTILEFV